MNAKIKFLGLAGMVSFLLVSCSKDEVQSSRQGEAITFNTNVTRATETSTQTLTKIKVYADAEGYKNMFIKGDVAEKKGSDNIFRFSTNYYWPNDVDVIKFWAYGPADIKNVVPNITGDGQSFETYTPVSGVNNPGAKHEDLVVAYTKADRHSGTGSNIKLVFNHAFTQGHRQGQEGPQRRFKDDQDQRRVDRQRETLGRSGFQRGCGRGEKLYVVGSPKARRPVTV